MMKVAKKCCGQCLFTNRKIVNDKRKKSILSYCQRNDTHFTCHKASIKGEDVVCRGFFDNHSTGMIRISERLRMIEYVDVEAM